MANIEVRFIHSILCVAHSSPIDTPSFVKPTSLPPTRQNLPKPKHNGHSTTKIRESRENDAITWNERQVERFVQEEVDISDINSAGTAYGPDEAALDDDIEHEEEDEFEIQEGEYESEEEAVSTIKDNLSIRTIIDCTISH
ncbi:hypothetical protein HO173_007906 [Letharia columbiana]|uniref:Uncharacterized protein n=1 Tax=Letharia columbiana TaxID=112416 RepID=A0A8H6FSU1_9LECA|nr:uncharacterized protein HO173_007906 [Letharia columbiana]KAF6234076.1 hypothetical protein HO173_007906 [Letharia columbiana]